MKISEMKTEENMDTICELINTVDDLLSDKEFVDEVMKVSGAIKPDLTTVQVVALIMNRRKAVINLLLKSKREELYKIISILSDKSVETIKGQLLIKTIYDAYTCFNDKELVDFFKLQVKSKVTN